MLNTWFTWAGYQRWLRRFLAPSKMLHALREAATAMRSCSAAARGAADALQRFAAAWDALPEATKEEVRRLDA